MLQAVRITSALLILSGLLPPIDDAQTQAQDGAGRAAEAKLVWIPGTHVGVPPLPGFDRAHGFVGLRDPDTGSRFSVLELRSTESTTLKGIQESTKKWIEGQRGKVLGQKTLHHSGRDALLFRWEVKSGDSGAECRTLCVLGTPRYLNVTTCVGVTAPEGVKQLLVAAVEGLKWEPERESRPEERFDWAFSPPAGLSVISEAGMRLEYTMAAPPESPGGAVATFIVEELLVTSLREPEERQAMRLMVGPRGRLGKIRSSQAVEIAGVKGWELEAELNGPPGEAPQVGYVLNLKPNRIWTATFSCTVAAAREVEWLPKLREAARSWRPVPAAAAPEPPKK